MGYLSMSWVCSGCKKSIADESDMLIEVPSEAPEGEEFHGQQIIMHVDHTTAIGVKLRTFFYGPYCNEECWKLDAQPGDVFNDVGRFTFTG